MIRVKPPVINWQTIKEFPKYEMNQIGEVRDIDTQIRVVPAVFKDEEYVELMREGKPYLNQVRRLLWATFPTGANPPFPLFGDV